MRQERVIPKQRRRPRPEDQAPTQLRPWPESTKAADELLQRIAEVLEVA